MVRLRCAVIDPLDRFVAPDIRARLEERYWHPIQRATTADAFLRDDSFFVAPGEHPGTFSDHGTVHVRDVARRAALLAAQVHGGLLPPRDAERLHLVQGIAVLLAYLHDIGMVAATPEGRSVHAQFAAQTALGDGFDDIADAMWATDAGGVRSAVERAGIAGRARVAGPVVLREVLALSTGHSKSAVPMHVLEDPAALRRLMLRATFTALDAQVGLPKQSLWTQPRDVSAPTAAVARYDDVDDDAFAWLLDEHPAGRAFVADVVDGIRVLRAADALRQRGTTQRTSAGYEVCVDRRTGRAVIAIRSEDARFGALMWSGNVNSVAEGNLRLVDLTDDGNLRVAVHRGAFDDPEGAERVVAATADIVADVEADAIQSFSPPPGAPRAGCLVEIVRPHDDPTFAVALQGALVERHPRLVGRVVIVEERAVAPRPESVDWHARGVPVDPHHPDVDGWLDELEHHGLRVSAMSREHAWDDVRRVRLRAGEVVFEPHTAASVVVVPLGSGLRVEPIGGYGGNLLHPWLPIGATGVVRGAERNATVVADREVDILAIPAERYLRDWFRPYEAEELREVWHRWLAARGA